MKEHRIVGIFAATIIALCLTGIAQAQTRVTPCSATTQNNEICLTITPSTADTNGIPLTRPPTFRVEQKLGSGAYAQIAAALTTIQLHVKGLAPGDYLFRVSQSCVSVPNVLNCLESTPTVSNSKTLSIPVEQPGAPLVIIAATIRANGPPTYRIVYTATPRTGEVLFAVPNSLRPLYAAR